MELVTARAEDSDELKTFFESFVISGRVDLRTRRHDNFFDLYRIQSDHYKVFLLKDDRGKIQGTTAVSYRQGYVNGKAQKIGLIRDLRVANDKKALITWSESFLPILEAEMEESRCSFYFSLIDENMAQSYNALIRPKSRKQKLPRYYLLRKFYLIALHGRLPLFFRPLATIHVRAATKEDAPDLVRYLNRKSKQRLLGPVFEEESFLTDLGRWPGLELKNFLIAYDSSGKIIGCVAPWNPSELKTLIVEKHHGFTNGARKLLTWGSHLHLTRRLAKEGEPLLTTHLTHLFADNPDVFHALLWHAWQTTPRTHTLLYPHFMGHIQTKPPRGFIYTKTPFAAYTILPPYRKLPSVLRPRIQSLPPYFEPALL